jgi:nucleotide-binding universal stress UspA family protein
LATQVELSHIAINRILLATDFSPESQSALQCAVYLAKRYQSTLFLTHVLPPEGSNMAAAEAWPAVADVMRHNAEQNMAELENTEGLRVLPHEVIIRSGDTWDVISKVLSDKNVDLIVMGTQGHGGIRKLFLGSTAEKVVRHATCAVLTLGPHVRLASLNRFGHIFYASDFSSGSMRALIYALSLAEEDRAVLTLLHVIESKPVSESELLDWKQQDREKLSHMIPPDIDLAYKPEIEVEIGIPKVEIVRLADTREAELIVMGCHSGGVGSTHLPWTTLHYVLEHAHCPVLTVCGEWSAVNRADAEHSIGVWFGQ